MYARQSDAQAPAAGAAHHRPFEERYAAGKRLRDETPREKLANFSAPERDPVAIFDETNRTRLPELLPIRAQRMAESPFTFLRGAAALMAVDLASQPAPGIKTQACGDCHLMNFGAFISPEGNVLFDINDFDETLPGVDFTVDLKRLAASCSVAALAGGASDKIARRVAENVARAYRLRMFKLAKLSPLEAWHSRILLVREASDLFEDDLVRKLRVAADQKHADRQEDRNFPNYSLDPKTGAWRIIDRPPLIYHPSAGLSDAARVDVAKVFEGVNETLAPETFTLISRYKLADSAIKVVGVGSVGTYCAVGLFTTHDGDPLFLQVKEALPSVLERLGGGAWPKQQGARVVSGQRIMQAATDMFLGWTTDPESNRQFYVRHLKNKRLGSVADLLQAKSLPEYATLCGRTLARAHARSADAATLAGYMGKKEAFDDAIASFAMLYAAQNKIDHQRFVAGGIASPSRSAPPA
ncbi:DUF2252 domain-containing protein [Methylocystis heyeri]|uniref:DUF2252 domain-containing protein n=1 Tax=Methylocystis heyeri TaxID=391905 RepID=A0A6B8KIF4_9HYPH|nr:DUF2252 domain-containing protein [Methylocystis heyeri]QGM47442.1 DUF2252 domain-containing protein [Methylocystis heyeri]